MRNIQAPEMKILSKIILCIRVWKMPFNPEREESMGKRNNFQGCNFSLGKKKKV